MSANTPYEILGEQGVRDLANAFYDAMEELPEAETIRNMHKSDLGPVREKLFQYLTGWFGGPPLYHEAEGTVCLTEPHAHYHIGPKERDQWLTCMNEALERIGASDELKEMVREPFFRIADTVRNQDSSERKKRPDNIIAAG